MRDMTATWHKKKKSRPHTSKSHCSLNCYKNKCVSWSAAGGMGKVAQQISDVHEQCCVSTKLKSRVTTDSWCLTSGQPCWSTVTSTLREYPQRPTVNFFQCSNVQKIKKKKKLIEKTSLLLLHSCGSPGTESKPDGQGLLQERPRREEGESTNSYLSAVTASGW